MESQTEKQPPTEPERKPQAKQEERPFSKAQGRHLAKLQSDVQDAQEALQKFISYLAEEHEIEVNGSWAVSPTGFVREEEPPKV